MFAVVYVLKFWCYYVEGTNFKVLKYYTFLPNLFSQGDRSGGGISFISLIIGLIISLIISQIISLIIFLINSLISSGNLCKVLTLLVH